MHKLKMMVILLIGALSCGLVMAKLPNYLDQVKSLEDYQKLSRVQNGLSFIKITYEFTSAEQNIYFQNTQKYEFHFPFLKDNIATYKNITYADFENLVFLENEKKLIVGAIYYNEKEKALAFNIYFGKEINLEQIVKTKIKIESATPFVSGKIIYIFPTQIEYLKNQKQLRAMGVESTSLKKYMDALDKAIVYSENLSYGYLKTLTAKQFEAGEYNAKDIIILNSVPLDIGPTSGIITTEPQIPHSHVILRAINQKIPDVYIPNAISETAIVDHLNQLIQFETKSDGSYTIKGEDQFTSGELAQLANDYFMHRIPNLPTPKFDLAVEDFLALNDIPVPKNAVKAYGAKGSNFAQLDLILRNHAIDRLDFKGAFLIPFSFYNNHLNQTLLSEACAKAQKACSKENLEDVCVDPIQKCELAAGKEQTLKAFIKSQTTKENITKMLADAKFRKASLIVIQKIIEKTEMNKVDKTKIKTLIKNNFPVDRRIRFRSSTNAEDLPGLNGAGLYDSNSGCLADEDKPDDALSRCLTKLEIKRKEALIAELQNQDPIKNEALIQKIQKSLTDKKTISSAIRDVFASLWSEKAFLSRDYYNIDHSKIFMGILVHPAFIDESANGVVIAKIQDNGQLNLNIVAQVDDISITNPELPGSISEQTIATFENDQLVEYNRNSNSNRLPPDRLNVLSEAQLLELGKQISFIIEDMTSLKGAKLIDFEFIMSHEGKILLKQVRPLE
ncbi:MAG: hypothetical protein A2381_05275 [Bdellovibrionales bacterium RIFOXYB1_FULL_37_110]|nr:MAG: hypothetical protein A2417_16755 [Bdellovibrionales bacterium RIFOXYC1_FULL_37_79]OFZ58157.1 MAG: hypothetical protein A2381_05275 [Bdellovibrionales bacterium RIFOXYB1_FULL_37_110]OFZ61846.1 MAG: hypothetical protein A2577_18860 [Bdellovibrionales bacterium RIFOXYD1_FULL_36_51]